MSDRVTSQDIMASLAALRKDVKQLLESHDDHERRISTLEPIKGQVERMAAHIAEIGRRVEATYQLLEGSDRLTAQALRVAGVQLSNEVTAMVRAEMSGLRDDVQALATLLNQRPCITGQPGCVVKQDG